MKLIDVLKFHSPNRIDWKATEAAIAEAVNKEYPEESPAEKTATYVDYLAEVKKDVRKHGVLNLYGAIQVMKSEIAAKNGITMDGIQIKATGTVRNPDPK